MDVFCQHIASCSTPHEVAASHEETTMNTNSHAKVNHVRMAENAPWHRKTYVGAHFEQKATRKIETGVLEARQSPPRDTKCAPEGSKMVPKSWDCSPKHIGNETSVFLKLARLPCEVSNITNDTLNGNSRHLSQSTFFDIVRYESIVVDCISMCSYSSICIECCWYLTVCVDMCRYVSMYVFVCLSTCLSRSQHVSICIGICQCVLICADMQRWLWKGFDGYWYVSLGMLWYALKCRLLFDK